jgi:hypothetical protein
MTTTEGAGRWSRRRFPTATGAAAALPFASGLPGVSRGTAARPRSYPFALGVASGDPLPDSVVIWTRLAPDALDPFGGMEYKHFPVAWEVAEDDAFRRVVQRGTALARPGRWWVRWRSRSRPARSGAKRGGTEVKRSLVVVREQGERLRFENRHLVVVTSKRTDGVE